MSFLKTYKTIWPGLVLLIMLITYRMLHTHTLGFAFLYWNLFLALLPLFFSHQVVHAHKPWQAWVSAALWLLFFPNAAYLFTDMVHLRQQHNLLYWLDLTILILSSIYGLVIGLLSLRQVESWYQSLMAAWMRPAVTFGLLLLCGYGIYLGRVERWNSWDVVAQPMDLLQAMAYHGRHPFRCKEVWLMSGLFGAGLYVLYVLFDRRSARSWY